LGDGVFFPPYAILVDKSKKKIHVVDNSSGSPVVIESYDSDLGKNPGDKHSLGDHRTPEGVYFLERHLEGPGLDAEKYGVKAFVTNYPNLFDVREGKSGGGIWLHAIADKVGLERGSRGCVVVRNDTIKKIEHYISLRQTPLMIFDKVQWVTTEQNKHDSDLLLQTLGGWRQAWESKDIDNYINYYATDFRFGKMNRDKWKLYKTELAAKYTQIKISLSMPVIFEHKNNFIVRFLQDYSSPDHTDFGEKTLYLRKSGNSYVIIGEEWQQAADPNARALLAGDKLCCQVSHN
jgi:murein L,D-transpeptidase YafK